MEIKSNPNLTKYMSELDVVISDSGIAELDSTWYSVDVCSPFSRIYLIRNGEGWLNGPGQDVLLRPDHAYFIPANYSFGYRCDCILEQLYFHINIYTAAGYDLLGNIDEIIELPLVKGETEKVTELYQKNKISSALRLQKYLLGIIEQIIEKSELGTNEVVSESTFLVSLYSIVNASLNSKTTQGDIARKMAISPRTLAKKFKEETGLTLGKYMQNLLFHKAQHLLISSDAPIYKISETLGFCDQFYFSRFFCQHQQESPSEYRKRQKNRI